MNSQLKNSIETWLVAWTANQLGLEAEAIEPSKSFLNYSTDSVTAMMLVGDLEDWLGLRLSPTLAWDYPSLAALAQYLAAQTEVSPATAKVELNEKAEISQNNTEQLLAQLDRLSEQEMNSLLGELLAAEEIKS